MFINLFWFWCFNLTGAFIENGENDWRISEEEEDAGSRNDWDLDRSGKLTNTCASQWQDKIIY